MRKAVVLVAVLGATLCASAQTAITPSRPALGVAGPALSVPSGYFVPGSAVLTPLPAGTNGSTIVTNLSIADVSAAMLNLQVALEQSLPVVAAVNFAALPEAFASPVPANASRNVGLNVATNAARSFGRNLGVNMAGNVSVPPPSSVPAIVPPAPVPAVVETNLLTADTIRALLALQSDMERMLPLLAQLNGTTNATAVLESEGGAAAGASETE